MGGSSNRSFFVAFTRDHRARRTRLWTSALRALVAITLAMLVLGAPAAVAFADDTSSSSSSTTSPTDTTPPDASSPGDTTPPDATPPDATPPDTATTTTVPPADATPPETTPTAPPTTTTLPPATTTTAPPVPTTTLLVRLVPGLSASEAADAIASHGGTETSSIAPLRLHVVEVPADHASEIQDAYRDDARVASASLDKVRDAESGATDPSYGDQWALPKIGWEDVHGSVAPAGSATLAVLDTGIDASVPDLAGRVVGGWSYDGSDAALDPNGHGTHMATIAAGGADDGTGIAGVAYAGVNVMPVRVLGSDGTGQDSDIIEGLVWAVDHGADVALLAFSNPGESSALQAAVDYAWSHGVIVVAAAGNDGSTSTTYPAGLSKVVGVGATDESDAVWGGSNQSDAVFIAAPGVSIAASDSAGVTSVTGTSASAAVVAGAAALLRANDLSASNATVVGRLARNADATTAGVSGNGRVNLARSIGDSSTDGVTPAGAPGGGPVVGPYVATALTAVTVGAQSASVVPGGSTTFPISVTNASGSTTRPVSITVVTFASPGTPTGVTFSSACVDVVGNGSPQTITLTINTTASTPVVTRTFTVIATRWSNAAGGGCSGTAADTFTSTNSGTLVVSSAKVNTTTTITSDTPDPSVVGQPYAVGVSVARASGTNNPSGTVTVSDAAGGATCTATLTTGVNPATGSCNLTSTTAAAKTLTATYNGDTNFNTSTSAGVPHQVNVASTTTTITNAASLSATPTVVGQPCAVTWSTTVTSPGAGTPTGNVTVSDGSGATCSAAVASGTCNLTSTSPGAPKTITATYAGDSNFATSTSTSATHTVTKANTSITITNGAALATASAVGGSYPVNWTASATAPGAGTLTGTVTVSDGTATCTAAVAAGTCNLTSTSAGTKTITASYPGDTNFNSSTSAGVSHVVKDTTSTSITNSGALSTGTVVGESYAVDVSVTATSGSGTPTGTVTVSDGSATCPATLSGGGGTATGSCNLTSTTPGSKTITASYPGDAAFNSSTSTGISHTVSKANTTATITNAPALASDSVVGQPYTVNYSVTVNGPGSGTPTGTVTVSDGSATCTGSVAAGTCNLISTTAGAKTITVSYPGDTNFNSSSSTGDPHTVSPADTTTTITNSAALATASAVNTSYAVNWSVAVNLPGAGTPTGTVTVSDGAASCSASVATGTCNLTSTTTGTKSITATYNGSANFNGSTSTGTSHDVVTPPSVTSISPTSGPAAGATSVQITGANFLGATGVKFGVNNATGVVVVDDTTITATSPSGTANTTVHVNVVKSGLASANVTADQFTYVAAPTVSSINPNQGPAAGGASVTIAGTNFSAITSVKFGNTNAASFLVSSTTSITAVSPARGAEPAIVNVTVTNAAGTSSPVNSLFTFLDPPTITSVTPASGPLAGSAVRLRGTGFISGSSVKFGSADGLGESLGSDGNGPFLDVNAPAQAAGTVDVSVTNDGGTSANTAADDYTYAPVPTVTSVVPNSGTTLGGTSVTITGTGFITGSAVASQASAVRFGVTNATTFAVVNSTTITATAPARAAGATNVTVVTPGGTSTTGAGNVYTYTLAPTSTSITNAASLATGTVTGQPYAVNWSTTVNPPGSGTPASGTVTVSDGSATCTAAVAAGTCNLTSTTIGTKNVVATYNGDTTYATSASSGVSHVVSKADTTTTITNGAALATASLVASSYAVNVTVAPVAPGGGSPSGTVTVSDGTDSCNITLASGSGSCNLVSSTAGSKTITASYPGDANYNASNATGVPHTVNRARHHNDHHK